MNGQLEARLLTLVTLGLVAFGLVMVYSATSAPAALGGGDPGYYLKKQGVYALAGLIMLVVASRVPFRALRGLAPGLVLTSIGLLLAVLVLGEAVNGARRWLTFGPAVFQPSELAKLAFAVWAAAYLARKPAPQTLGELARPIGLLALVFCGLVLAEPDLGTAITIVLMLGGVLLVSGTPVRLLGTAGALVAVAALAAIWLEPYRRARLFSFLDPWSDPQNAGFQSVQALISLGSGGPLGTGLGQSVRQGVLPPRGAHGHDLRDRRRGARPGRDDARDRGLRRLRLHGHADRAPLQGPVRQAAGGGPDDARLAPRRSSTSPRSWGWRR